MNQIITPLVDAIVHNKIHQKRSLNMNQRFLYTIGDVLKMWDGPSESNESEQLEVKVTSKKIEPKDERLDYI